MNLPNPKKILLKYVLKRKFENFSKPGFVTANVGSGEVGTELREYFLPEQLMANLEDRVEEVHGEEGVKKLYEAGKQFGYEYTELSNFPSIDEVSEKELQKSFDLFNTYIELVYAEKIDYEIDYRKKIFETENTDFIICRKNGKGYTMLSGATAGHISSIFNEKKIEATEPAQTKENVFRVASAKPEMLEEEPISRMTDLEVKTKRKKYERLNRLREVEDRPSLKQLKRSENYSYTSGKFKRKDQVMFIVEGSFLYHLESKLSEIGAEEQMFQTGFEYGKKIGLEDSKELENLLTATGFGRVSIEGEEIVFSYFPWTPYFEEVEMELLKGYISGLVTRIKDEETRFKRMEKKIEGNDPELRMVKSDE